MKNPRLNFTTRLRRFTQSHLPKLWFILLLGYVIFSLTTPFVWTAQTSSDVIHGFVKATVLAVILCPLFVKIAKRLPHIRPQAEHYPLWETGLFFLIPFLFFLFHLAVNYPGWFTYDNMWQYGQAIFMPYDDWHPVVSTLILFQIPNAVFPSWIGAFATWQIVLFSSAILYCCYSVRKYTNRKTSYILLALFLLHPQTGPMSINPCKDVLFAIACLTLVTFAVHIYFTNGQWLRRTKNLCLVIFLIAVTTLLRHNAVLFTAPFAWAVMCHTSWKRALAVAAGVCLLVAGVKCVMFPLMRVRHPDYRQIEVLGMPMSIIGAVAAHQPEKLDEETKELAYRVAPPEVWKIVYNTGFNNVKWHPRSKMQVIEEYGVKRVLRMAKECFKRAPLAAWQGVIAVTHPIYSIVDYIPHYQFPSIEKNPYDFRSAPLIKIPFYKDVYRFLITLWFPHFYLGFLHLLLLILWNTCTTLKNCRKILFTLPVFCYNFGTAFLLSGSEDCWRFFFYAFLVVPVLVIFFLSKPKSAPKSSKKEVA